MEKSEEEKFNINEFISKKKRAYCPQMSLAVGESDVRVSKFEMLSIFRGLKL